MAFKQCRGKYRQKRSQKRPAFSLCSCTTHRKSPALRLTSRGGGMSFEDRIEGRKTRREMEIATYFTSSKSTYSLSSLVKIFSCCRPVWVPAEPLLVFCRPAFCCSRALKSARVCWLASWGMSKPLGRRIPKSDKMKFSMRPKAMPKKTINPTTRAKRHPRVEFIR